MFSELKGNSTDSSVTQSVIEKCQFIYGYFFASNMIQVDSKPFAADYYGNSGEDVSACVSILVSMKETRWLTASCHHRSHDIHLCLPMSSALHLPPTSVSIGGFAKF